MQMELAVSDPTLRKLIGDCFKTDIFLKKKISFVYLSLMQIILQNNSDFLSSSRWKWGFHNTHISPLLGWDKLVWFPSAVQHLLRISRILGQRQGGWVIIQISLLSEDRAYIDIYHSIYREIQSFLVRRESLVILFFLEGGEV